MMLRSLAVVLFLAAPFLLAGPAAMAHEHQHFKAVVYDAPSPYLIAQLAPPQLDDVPEAPYRIYFSGGATDYASQFQDRVPVQVCVTFDDGDQECSDVFIKRTVHTYDKPVARVQMWVYAFYADTDGETYGATRGTVGYWLS